MSRLVIDEIRAKVNSFDNYSSVPAPPTAYSAPAYSAPAPPSLDTIDNVKDTSIFTTIMTNLDDIIGEGKSKFVIPTVIFIILGVGYLIYKKKKDKKNKKSEQPVIEMEGDKDNNKDVKKLVEQIQTTNEKPKTNLL